MGGTFDWTLSRCCSREQQITASFWGLWSLLIIVTWNFRPLGVDIFLQFKLITTFLHEVSHAAACCITGGKVKSIEVFSDQGGVTRTVGGVRWFVLIAGYLGSAFWGFVFTVMSSLSINWVRAAASVLLVQLLLVLLRCMCGAGNCCAAVVCSVFIVETVAAWVCTELFETIWPLRIVLLTVGASSGVYSLIDIVSDTIIRKEKESDAYKIAQLTHCSSRLCGTLWALLAAAALAATLYLLLAITAVGADHF